MLIGQIPVSRIWFNGFAIGNDLVVEGIAVATFAGALTNYQSGGRWLKDSSARPLDGARHLTTTKH
jgi:hypothetical protein